MIPIEKKEHLIYFMQCGVMRLSKVDLRFLHNLNNLILNKNNLTTNQIDLFEKLLKKYVRQLNKHGLTKNKIDQLNWESTIVKSDSNFTDAFIFIENNIINFRSPFNKKFLESLHKIPYNTFRWSKQSKLHYSNFSSIALKIIVELSTKYFSMVHFCEVTNQLLDKLKKYNDIKYWQPTLVEINNRLYILGISNQVLGSVVSKMELSSDPNCLCELSQYGVSIHKDIINKDPINRFAGEFITEIDLRYIDNYINYLKVIECDAIFLGPHYNLHGGRSNFSMTPYKKMLFEKLLNANIIVDHNSEEVLSSRVKKYKKPILITLPNKSNTYYHNFYKILVLQNSNPVVIP